MQQPQRPPAHLYLAAGHALGLPANDASALRNWVVDITRADGTPHSVVIEARESWDAVDAADALEPAALRREVRPLIELTEREGRNRWPDPLHQQATTEANAGWTARAERAALADMHQSNADAYGERANRAALTLQIQQNPQHWGIA